jgi:chromate transporter
MSITLTLADWGSLFLHFISLSLLAVGGAITTAPDIHRYLVDEMHWLSDTQFTSSIALAQGAPGPNVMFIALMGWNVGLNAGGGLAAGWPAVGLALWGVLVTMVGIMIPSCTLTFVATQWAHRNRDMLAVKAFKSGMAPIVIALLVATGWLLASTHNNPATDWPLWITTVAATLLVWRTKLHLLWLLGTGAALGALGLI